MEITDKTFFESKVGHIHHNIDTIASYLTSAKRCFALHKSVRITIFDADGISVKAIAHFNMNKENFIKSGCGIRAGLLRRIAREYESGDVFRIEVIVKEI